MEKTEEKFKNDQEIKNIIKELYIKQKNSQYLYNEKRRTLKKYNLQEKIQREEIRIIKDDEEEKNNDIFNDAIQKLAARHMIGFEPLTVIRQKILNKIQSKYNINEENMTILTNYFESNAEDDNELETKRKEKQIETLEIILSDNTKFDYKEIDKATIIKVKSELKNYEKELTIKASQIEEEDNLNNIDQFLLKDQNENNINLMQEEDNYDSMDNEYDEDLKIKISNYILEDKDEKKLDETINEFNKGILDEIKNEMNEEMKEENKIEEEKICHIDEYNEFNSSILNNLAWKLKYQKKLSDFDNQILLYVTHSVIDELNCAKKNKRDFNFIISPQDLMKFLKEFHVEKMSDSFSNSNDAPKKSVSASPNTNSQL